MDGQKKSVRVRVKSCVVDELGAAQRFSSEAMGTYVYRGGKHYIRYEEELSRGETSQVTLKLMGNSAKLLRGGGSLGVEHLLHFLPEQETRSSYQTPYGDLSLAIHTEKLALDVREGQGSVHIVYRLYLEGRFQSRNTLCIELAEG